MMMIETIPSITGILSGFFCAVFHKCKPNLPFIKTDVRGIGNYGFSNVQYFFYICRGSALQKRLRDREKEIEADERDRKREKEELEEIRQRLLAEGHPDPDAELQRVSIKHFLK